MAEFVGSAASQADFIWKNAESSQPRGFSMQSERRSSLLKEKPQLIWITSTCLKSKSIGSPRLLAAEDLLDTIGETC